MAHPYPEMQGTSNPDFNAVQGEGGSPGGSKGGRKGGAPASKPPRRKLPSCDS